MMFLLEFLLAFWGSVMALWGQYATSPVLAYLGVFCVGVGAGFWLFDLWGPVPPRDDYEDTAG